MDATPPNAALNAYTARKGKVPSSASASAPTSASPALTRAKWTRPKSTKPAVKTRVHWESYTTASSKRASLRKTSPPLPPASLYESRSAVNAATWHHASAYAAFGSTVGTLYTVDSGLHSGFHDASVTPSGVSRLR